MATNSAIKRKVRGCAGRSADHIGPAFKTCLPAGSRHFPSVHTRVRLQADAEDRPAVKAKPRVEKNRVLVTGGAGFVGSHLCEFLVNRGDHVRCWGG